MDRHRLLKRFLRYVNVPTTAREAASGYPSSPGQFDLGRMLVEELQAMGLEDACQTQHGIVLATVPATMNGPVPTVAFCAHLDTSPESPGEGIRPQVIENYPGGDIPLPGDPGQVIRVEENPELDELRGCTLVTTDGTTLLGADDKSGVADIMEAVEWLAEHPEIKHGPIRVCFTCDEEIGRGTDRLDLEEIAAVVCYTLDSSGTDRLDVETFSADLAVVTIRGINIHPSIAKGRMTNAIRAAARFVERLPRDRLSPETTDDREGFLHPYELSGGVAHVTIRILLRDFETPKLAEQADLVREAAAATMAEFPNAKIGVDVKPQYRNMAEGLAGEPRAVEYAEKALERLGRTTKRKIIRGGTDGSRLTEMGLPTPNLGSGQHNPHSPLEWACLEEMELSAEWVVALAEVWAENA